ncbi:MAG: 3-hydroxyisobutyrate dehydrogenase [Nitrospirales bacterium]|nr:MAG: 3-hydroxyisobutyrate dehydrogenase [Nitrospirales bacterium]
MNTEISGSFELPSPLRIGWIGTGVMGAPMCEHILRHGYDLTVFTRSREKAKSLLDQGAHWADYPGEVASHCDVVFTIVGFPNDVQEVYFGKDGLLAQARDKHVFIDMTTSRPTLAREIAAYAETKGAYGIDAPVSGGDIGAKNATLSIMVGGNGSTVDALRPLLSALGTSIVHQGGPGNGQHTKLCNQITIAGTMIGVCESLLYGYQAGLDLNTMLSSIQGGAAACWTLDNLAPRMLNRNFDPGFYVDHFIKDMEITLEESKRMGIQLPGLSLVHQLYRAVQAHGFGQLGTHALLLGLEHLSDVQVKT